MGLSEHCAEGADSGGSRCCIIVCGLHRSGTSAITRLVNLLGADVARDLSPAGPDNVRGYWESNAVLAIHGGLLQRVAASQSHSFDPTPLAGDWLATEAARQARRRLARVVQREFAGSRCFVVKDPRIWRVLPLWLELLPDLDIAPIAVIPFRNPLEIAASLAQRDRTPLSKALLLYFCAYLEAERASRTIPRVFVRYDRLLEDWRPFARRLAQIAGAALSAPSPGAVIEIERFLTADLYHHRSSREQMTLQPEISAAMIEMFDQMDKAAETGDETMLRGSFDRLRADAESTARLYDGYLLSELQYLRQELMQIRESFETSASWRVTAPLRWLKSRMPPKE